ncbi:hypothetical protein ACFL5Z_01560 [Planctomycetota bacterium]
MTTASVITMGLNAIFVGLTPVQRWNAARQSDSSFMSERWFILAGLVTIIILTILLNMVSYHRRTEERRISNRRFFEYADKIGLTNRERQILQDIATRAELRRNVSIFSMIQAYDRGTARIIEDTLALQGVDASKRLSAEMSALREKLGFEKQYPTSVGSAKPSSRPSSRQIPPGKKLYVTCPNADDLANIESIVIKNNDVQLTTRLATPFQRNAGELCCVRYCFGGSVWEYDATVVSCQDDILILTHSNNVRFINRRRFLRVPVSMPAFIAHFPFVRTLLTDTKSRKRSEPDSTDSADITWGKLDFVPATATELAGPGLRVEAPLEVKIGERVLIILKLSEENRQDHSTPREVNSLQLKREQRGKMTPLKIVQDIGEIRHTEAIQGGFSTGLELTGLSDSDVNELIRATNAASVKAHTNTQDGSASDIEDYGQAVPEPVIAQGM